MMQAQLIWGIYFTDAKRIKTQSNNDLGILVNLEVQLLLLFVWLFSLLSRHSCFCIPLTQLLDTFWSI